MKATLGSVAFVALSLIPVPGQAAAPPASPPAPAGPLAKPAARPRIEVVFALDTTGSMGGLIEGAKAKIWSIARALSMGEPRPEVAIGLVAYRDLGDEYVTRVTPLTTDLDAVYGDLMALRAEGGGDGPEHVNRALADAVEKAGWSTASRVTRMVFLVGDAPPHMDYPQDVLWPVTVERAVRSGIVVNTVRCGSDSTTEAEFRAMARRGEGRYVSLAQDGGMSVVATPFDEELQELRRELGGLYLSYGARPERKAREESFKESERRVAAAAAPAAADRAAYLAVTGKAGLAEKDLLADVAAGKVAVEKLAQEELPDELRGLDGAARAARLAQLQEARAKLEARIVEVSRKRDAFLAEGASRGSRDSFDEQVLQVVREQAARQGVKY